MLYLRLGVVSFGGLGLGLGLGWGWGFRGIEGW
jgi:hypothetical protein